MRWPDALAVAALSGIGFTVSLLPGELAFENDPLLTDEIKAAVLLSSLLSAVLAGILLKLCNNTYRSRCVDEEGDEDGDGIPDICQEDEPACRLRTAEIFERRAAEHRRLAQLGRDGLEGDDR